ncbi:hypothetical protein RP20_CCG021362 [Aedes albopictus]|nr:uncharacterized protein LOC109431735 [Aedes albopictus]KXJ81139.1 hypothetical protein RP20_CCG021362 [Aedes albopictus]
MPFAVIETINARGSRELSVVPNNWLRRTPGGYAVLWPDVSVAEQEKYLCNENSYPDSSWLRYNCTVKHNMIGSYNHAMSVLDDMSVEEGPSKKMRHEESQNFLQELVNRNSSRLGERNHNGSTPKISQIGIRAGERFPANASAHTETVQLVSDDEADHVEVEDPIQKCLDKMDIIIGMQQRINQRLDLLEKRVAGISQQNCEILEATRLQERAAKSDIEQTLSFSFNPMDTEEELEQLERNLDDKEFNAKLVKWLRVNVSGSCAEDRMLCVLDLLFTKKFQTMCTWTGASRKGPKTAIMPNRNILEIFQIIGSDEKEVVNQRELANFFMKKLKNSLKRLTISGVRRSTRHVRRRKKLPATQPEGTNASEVGSSVSEAELEADFTYADEDTSDVHEHTTYVNDSPPIPENNYDPYFIVKVEQ